MVHTGPQSYVGSFLTLGMFRFARSWYWIVHLHRALYTRHSAFTTLYSASRVIELALGAKVKIPSAAAQILDPSVRPSDTPPLNVNHPFALRTE